MSHRPARKKRHVEGSSAAGDEEAVFLAFVLANIFTILVMAIVIASTLFSQQADYGTSPSARHVAQVVDGTKVPRARFEDANRTSLSL
jgi:ferric-dicitrate binding protein FerR (iron transport regulator)